MNGKYNDEDLCELFKECWKTTDLNVKETDRSTLLLIKQLDDFEVLTDITLKYFEKKKVDIALVEVGLGGIRDATNVFDENSLEYSILTNIGEEHVDALGGSIESIVRAKTGICRNRSLDIHRASKRSKSGQIDS